MIRSMSYRRNLKIPNPMLTGSANAPIAATTERVLPSAVGSLRAHTSTLKAAMKRFLPTGRYATPGAVRERYGSARARPSATA